MKKGILKKDNPNKVRRLLRNFHYNSRYSPVQAERDLNMIYSRYNLKPIRWRYEGKGIDHKTKHWYGSLAGRKWWHIMTHSTYFLLYDNTDILLTEKQNPIPCDSFKEAKYVARKRLAGLVRRMLHNECT